MTWHLALLGLSLPYNQSLSWLPLDTSAGQVSRQVSALQLSKSIQTCPLLTLPLCRAPSDEPFKMHMCCAPLHFIAKMQDDA